MVACVAVCSPRVHSWSEALQAVCVIGLFAGLAWFSLGYAFPAGDVSWVREGLRLTDLRGARVIPLDEVERFERSTRRNGYIVYRLFLAREPTVTLAFRA